MKYFSILVLSLVSVALFAQGAKQVDINYVQSKAAPYESIILQGDLTHQLDWDEFILTDGTGSVKLELEGPAKYEMSQNLLGANVRVYGVVDKDHQWDRAEVKALKIRVMGQAKQPANNQKATAPAANQQADSASGEVNMNGRDDLAEAYENAFNGGPASNIPDNF